MHIHCLTNKIVEKEVIIHIVWFLLFLCIGRLGLAQTFPYQQKWEEIEKKEMDGSLKSLRPLVRDIYLQAKKDKNPQQRIKALLYQSKITITTEEGTQKEATLLALFKEEIDAGPLVEKSILQSLLAELLNEYYQQNRYRITQRTNTSDTIAETKDLLTWTEASYKREIAHLYNSSLIHRQQLQAEPVENWTFILDTASQYRELRPTVFDLLAHRAIAYYGMYDQQEKSQEIIQLLINQHANDTNKNAYLYNCLQQLTIGKQVNNADTQIEQFKKIAEYAPGAWFTAEVKEQLVVAYQRLINEAPKESEKKKQYADTVLRVCREVDSLYPLTNANKRLQQIKDNMLRSEINVQIETVNLPKQPIPVYLSHKNVDKIYVKVLAYKRLPTAYLADEFNARRHLSEQKDVDSVIHRYDEVQSYAIALKHFADYQPYATLLKFEALANGEYLLAISNNASFQLDSTGIVTFQPIKVSTHALAFKNNTIFLTDREEGKPIKNAKITIYRPAANEKDVEVLEEIITSEDGTALSNEKKQERVQTYQRLWYQVEGDEVFFTTDRYFPLDRQDDEEEEEAETKIQFFTDRAIYRPGQTVYFKGIVYQETKGKRRVMSHHKATVELYDPNNDDIASQALTSNTYGSIFGSFVLPTGKMTGQYYLEEEDAEGRKEFRVEEYKKPNFEVLMDTVKETFKIGGMVRATGQAQSFAGASITEGKVSYRVTRHQSYPYRSWSRPSNYYPYKSEEIAIGEVLTDVNGKFEIPFRAKPAEEKKEDAFRFYNYNIEVSVTDVNGETHEGSQTIAIGDKSIVLHIPLPPKINIEQLDSIGFQTDNLNGQHIDANGNIKLTKLRGPDRVLRKTRFGKVDYMLLDSADFIKAFPHLPYGNEQDTENWLKGDIVLNTSFHSARERAVGFEKKEKLTEGTYLLEAYVLDGQDTLRTSQLVELFSAAAKKPLSHEFLRVSTDKAYYEAGEEATISLASAIPTANVLVELEQNGKVISKQQIILNNSVRKLKIPIDENTLDNNVYVHYYLGRYNAVEQGVLAVPVQQKANKLMVSMRTFRDKLQPGQDETWELNIGGSDKDKAAAEVLAAMYDASLNQFAENTFYFPPAVHDTYSRVLRWDISSAYAVSYSMVVQRNRPYPYIPFAKYEDLEHFGFSFMNNAWKQQQYIHKSLQRQEQKTEETMLYSQVGERFGNDAALEEVVVVGYGKQNQRSLAGAVVGVQLRGNAAAPADAPLYVVDGEIKRDIASLNPADIVSMQVLKETEATALYGAQGAHGVIIISTKQSVQEAALLAVKARTNLKETAFFYPDLHTDAEGNIKIRFTTPESLTQWRFMLFAHTPTLETGYFEQTVRTSKDLMVVPNVPRFLRQGDELIMSTKVVNLSGERLSGAVKLMLFDAETMQPIDSLYDLDASTQPFEAKAGGNEQVSWRIKVPASQALVVYRIVASAGNFSDGEEAVLPILPNQMLVTETLSLFAREGQTKNFTMQALAEAPKDAQHVRLTLELTSNPIWYAIQALPYLQEYPYECSEQLFAKLYSTLVSKKLIDHSPRIKAVFDEWNKKGMLQSKLATNEALKSILLEETPWVQEAENEETRMKRLALLFDINNVRNQWQSTYQKFAARQLSSGGFPWFEGGNADLFITTHIVAGFGHLKNLKVDIDHLGDSSYRQVLGKAIVYLDEKMESDIKKNPLEPHGLGYDVVYYLYARSYFMQEFPIKEEIRKYAFAALEKQIGEKHPENLQEKAMLAMVYNRFNQPEKGSKLLHTLKEYAVDDDEMGMYWKENVNGWNWWQSPIETQAALIEAFHEMKDTASAEQLKRWLIKNKQTNQWGSTKATTEAIYALLFAGKDWVDSGAGITVKVGGESLDSKTATLASGYAKTSWEPGLIKPEMAHVEVSKTSVGPMWGALYWQYVAPLGKIKTAANGVALEKELFLKLHTANGPVLKAITSDTPIQVGDLVTVRLILRADRDLSFIHLKDMRASGFEPVNVLSAYKWQGGLGYYESTRDAATNFFIDRMQKGTYVFEYDVRANNAGRFANGISSIQCMYAPEMSAHSAGINVQIEHKK